MHPTDQSRTSWAALYPPKLLCRATLHPTELRCTLLSYASPSKQRCILLSYVAPAERSRTLLSYYARHELWFSFRATLHPMSYASPSELLCTLLKQAALYWATLHLQYWAPLYPSELISTLWAHSLHSIELGCTPLSCAVHCWVTLHWAALQPKLSYLPLCKFV